jgi:hypothetical protein
MYILNNDKKLVLGYDGISEIRKKTRFIVGKA